MPSIIHGYEYDIFISYRQKDNKGEKWVSRFVDALKTELEATFKEDISVYFDENPHDRLQETHNVDKSLASKLKCLIFIPILSQTYCDPNSYAWQYEFLSFVKMTKSDPIGKDVRLRGGNVASRILPIRIHDLEPEDVKLFEKETESVLRALDFIFKTGSGVSRPLKDNEDHPQDNLNKTFYSDQINKVGHAIKEIILGIKKEPEKVEKENTKEVRTEESILIPEKFPKHKKRKFIPAVAIAVVLVIISIFAFPKIFKRDTLEKLRSSGERISVAVMPFQNMTNDTTWNVWQDGIQDILITSLSNSGELIVRQSESIVSLLQSKGLANYASITPAVAGKISKNLNADVFICGNIIKSGGVVRLYAQLTDSKTEEIIKSFQIEGSSREENLLPIIDSLSVMLTNFLVISKLEREEPLDHLNLASTNSPEAYRYFLNGNNAFHKGDYSAATSMLSRAIAIDSTFTIAKIFLCFAYNNQGLIVEAKRLCHDLYGKREQMTTKQKLWTDFIHAVLFETVYERIKYLKQFVAFDDQVPLIYSNLGGAYLSLNEYDKAILVYEKALNIYAEWNSKPIDATAYYWLGYAYHKTGQFRKEKELYESAELDFSDDLSIIYRQAVLALSEGRTGEPNKYIEKLNSIQKENSVSEAEKATRLSGIYDEAEILDKAEEYYSQALSLEPENPVRMNNLAYFLIDRDRNIGDGLKLIERALRISSENYEYLDTKGWGLYKLGKYAEALEVLQKSWDLRREKAVYNHEAWLHLEAAKKAKD